MGKYDGFVALSKRLIKEKGGKAVLRQLTKGGTEDVPTLTPTDTDITAVRVHKQDRTATGTNVEQVLETLLISTQSGLVPQLGDMIAFGYETAGSPPDNAFSRIGQPVTVSPDGTDILYRVPVLR